MGDYFFKKIGNTEHNICQKLRKIQWLTTAATIVLLCLFFCSLPKSNPYSLDHTSTVIAKNHVIVWGTYVPWVLKSITIKCFDKKCDVVPICDQRVHGDAYLFHGYRYVGLPNLPLPRKNTAWGLLHEEGPTITLEFAYEIALKAFNFSSTFSSFSDVPFPLMWMESLESLTSLKYFVNTSMKNVFLQQNSPIIAVYRDCVSGTNRESYMIKLNEYLTIDSYGSCLNNKRWPSGYLPESDTFQDAISEHFMIFAAKYKFFFAVENNVCNNYVTEKFWRSLKLGVVPIYFGSPLIREWLPNNKSAILIDDYPTPELLSIHLRELLQNDSKYEEYLEHKTKGLISNKRLFEEIKARPYQTDMMQAVNKFQCLVCERLHDRDSAEVNVVTKKHFDCPKTTSVMTFSFDPNNVIAQAMEKVEPAVAELYGNTVWNPNVTNDNRCLF